MGMEELLQRLRLLIRQNLLVLALGSVGLILFAYGLISLFLLQKPIDSDVVFEKNEANSENIRNTKEEKLTIDIGGSVVNPGVYDLPLGSRIQDAITIAGGLSESVDREFVAKSINLATKLSDGAKIYIPKIGESAKGATSTTGITGSAVTNQININSASEQELDSLPGIGSVTSQKIIAGRPYNSIEDLLSKKIVGSKVFEEIKEKISVY